MKFKMWVEAKLGIEAAPQVMPGLYSIRSNLYYKTRPYKPNGDKRTALDYFRHSYTRMLSIKEWINRSGFPVSQKHLDGALSAMNDAMIDLHQLNDPNFTPASYFKGADPKNAETLGQFATFLNKRIEQKPVPHKILEKVAQEWDAFIEDFMEVYKRLLNAGEFTED